MGEVLIRNNRTTTDSFITDDILEDWIRDANRYCSTFKPWPFVEARDQTTSWSGTEEIDYSSFAVDYLSDSVRMILVGGKRLRKTNFEDYLIFREQSPSATDRIFSDYNRVLYINPNADVSGTLAAYGRYLPAIDPTDLTASTVFSTYDEEGNEALVEKMTSYLKRREHLPDEAELHDQRADAVMEKLWSRIGDEQHRYHTHRDRGGLWERVDVVNGNYEADVFKRDQFT